MLYLADGLRIQSIPLVAQIHFNAHTNSIVTHRTCQRQHSKQPTRQIPYVCTYIHSVSWELYWLNKPVFTESVSLTVRIQLFILLCVPVCNVHRCLHSIATIISDHLGLSSTKDFKHSLLLLLLLLLLFYIPFGCIVCFFFLRLVLFNLTRSVFIFFFFFVCSLLFNAIQSTLVVWLALTLLIAHGWYVRRIRLYDFL